jgi:dipeptidyl aminopeptidase/acylaminoacyl peptidase
MMRIHLPTLWVPSWPSLLCAALLLGVSATAIAARVERGNLIFDNIPEPPAGFTAKLDAYLNSRRAVPLGFSPKGHLLIATRFGDVDQLHLVERPGGERRQLTFLREPITRGAFSPDPARSAVAFLEDQGGNENTQLYYQRVGEPAARLLTDGKSMNGAPLWSNAGREIAFFTTARDGVSHDIDVVDAESGNLPHLAVTGDSAAWYPLDWSPDDRKLLVLKYVSIAEAHLYVVDLSDGQKREIDPAPGKVGIRGAKFSRDGQGVYFISDHDSEFAQLRSINLFTNEKTVISAHLPWDVAELAISRDGHYLAYASNEAGAGKLYLLDLRTHQDLIPPKLPGSGVVDSLSFDAEGTHLAFGFASPNQPEDAYVLNIAANRVDAWTASEAGPVDLAKFVMPRLTQYPTFDRADGRARQIPVYVYEPSTPGRHPVLIVLHGGPESQFRLGFDPFIEYVVNELGFAVVAPNVRGSSGYGKSYLALDNGTLREDAMKDVGALIVWIGLQGAFDAKHVVVSGDAYGGYLALDAMVNFGDRLRGAVDVAGMTDFISFLTNTAPYRQDLRRAEYGDERDPDMRAFLRRISPLTNAERIVKPLLIVQGKNDARVPASESDQLVNRLRSKGGQVWYLIATDEGHGFRKKQNRDAYYRAFAQFLKATSE